MSKQGKSIESNTTHTAGAGQVDDAALCTAIKAGEIRAMTRLISIAENNPMRACPLIAKLCKDKINAPYVLGVTGAPGAGKSTLVDHIAHRFKQQGKRVAVLAIDPSSPISGGAVLGDRIRMETAAADPDIFIRSLATRGALGGMSWAALDAIQILGAAGFDLIVLETAGVGQTEVDIVKTAHTCIVVVVPGMGDSVQSMKAGVLEIADVYVINKADRAGTAQLQRDLKSLLSLAEYEEQDWQPPVLQTVATENSGLEELVEAAASHYSWLHNSIHGTNKRLHIMEESIMQILTQRSLAELRKEHAKIRQAAKRCVKDGISPLQIVEELAKQL